MSKRRTESTSTSESFSESEEYSTDSGGSSQSSIDDPSFTMDTCGQKKSHKTPSGNERKSSVEQRKRAPVASTSTQNQNELRNIVQQEVVKMEVESTEVAESAPRRMDVACATSAAANQSTSDAKRSKRKLDSSDVWTSEDHKPPPPSRRVTKASKKYFEGCLVMGRFHDYPFPGMIRKAGEDDNEEPDYISFEGNISFCVQFFRDPITLRWLEPCFMRIFDLANPNRCYHRDPKDVVDFQKGIRIAKAALKYSVEARLEKFTLPSGAAIDDLLREIDNLNFQNTINATPQQPHPPVPLNNFLVQERNAAAATTQENGVSGSDLVSQQYEESSHPPNENGEVSHESVEIMMTKRISEYQQKLRDECNREKNEEIKELARNKAELEAIVEEKEKEISDLRIALGEKDLKHRMEIDEKHLKHKMEMEKVNLKHRQEMEKEKQEKLKLQHELETRIAVFEKMFPGSQT